MDPRDPTLPDLRVLPWDVESSWTNFCTILRSWRFQGGGESDTTRWFKKSSYRIFNNMVNNLRQSGSARSLLMKWRPLVAAKSEDTSRDVKAERKEDNTKLSHAVDASTEPPSDRVIFLKHLLREKFGLDSNLTVRQQQNRLKSDLFRQAQQNSLEFIHRSVVIPLGVSECVSKSPTVPCDILKHSLRRYINWDEVRCQRLCDQLFSNVSSLNEDKEDSEDVQNQGAGSDVQGNGGQEVFVLVDQEKDIQLSKAQEQVVDDLKAAIQAGQLLGFLQGFPGAGKTTTSKKMADVTGLRVLFCGSTGTASAQFHSRTINSFLKLGLSVDNIDLSKATTSGQVIAKVVAAVENYDLILIDEASMITPVTLARIDLRLRHCFNPELPFGGKHILLCGDMWQFPPVSGLRKSALYQAAVVVATNKKVPNEAYRAGANLFTKFKLFVLNDQQRCAKDYADYLAPLRDTTIKSPITRE